MTRSSTLALLAVAVVFIIQSPDAKAGEAAKKPNILFVFADDMAFDTSPAGGCEDVATPNLDRLRSQGHTFSHVYNMGGWHGAVCVASRTMLNTGRFLWHARDAEKTLKKQYQEAGRTWSQLLAAGGYDTYFTGKWHVRMDTSKLFKVSRNVRPGMPNQVPSGYNRPLAGQPDAWKPWDKKHQGFWKGGKHWSEVVADDVLDYLEMSKSSENPFFMYVAFNAPHDPRQAPKEYVDRYPPAKITLPKPFLPEYPFNIGSNRIRDEKLAPFPRTKHAVQVNRAEYYAIITHLDAQIGRILDALEATGEADNTYIVFTADHGLACGHHGLMGKQNMFDHSIRVPFHVVGPGVSKVDGDPAPLYLQDIVPTSLEWAGLEVPDSVEFESFADLARRSPAEARESSGNRYGGTMYGAYTMTQRMVSEIDGHKLIVYPQIKKELLFDLSEDPLEEHDLAGDPVHAQTLSKLRKSLVAWQARSGDPLDLGAAMPKRYPASK